MNLLFHHGSYNEVIVTHFDEEACMNLLSPTYITEWVIKRFDLYDLIKMTQPFSSISYLYYIKIKLSC